MPGGVIRVVDACKRKKCHRLHGHNLPATGRQCPGNPAGSWSTKICRARHRNFLVHCRLVASLMPTSTFSFGCCGIPCIATRGDPDGAELPIA
jgi:hypothetical protein